MGVNYRGQLQGSGGLGDEDEDQPQSSDSETMNTGSAANV